MNAADLFKNQILDPKPNLLIKNKAVSFWAILKPPYKTLDLFTIGITLFLLITIPVTVLVANQVRDNRSKAASGPSAFFEDNFKKLNLKFVAKTQTLTLVNQVEDDTLPQPEVDKKDGKNTKIITFDIAQINKLSQPVFKTSRAVTIPVNDKGEALTADVYFSVQVQDVVGTATISLSGKKLLGVGI